MNLPTDSWEPLDEDEGPTLWVQSDGEHTVKLAAGTDPKDPYTVLHLSVDEVRKLNSKI